MRVDTEDWRVSNTMISDNIVRFPTLLLEHFLGVVSYPMEWLRKYLNLHIISRGGKYVYAQCHMDEMYRFHLCYSLSQWHSYYQYYGWAFCFLCNIEMFCLSLTFHIAWWEKAFWAWTLTRLLLILFSKLLTSHKNTFLREPCY